VDGSPAQIEAARARGLDAHVMDGQALAFEDEFDAVFSNAAMHWMKRADAVIAGVHRALRPGGRFVGEFGGEGCVAHIRTALIAALERRGIDGAALDPWYFPDVASYGRRLEAGGLMVRWIALIPRPTPLPGDVVGWLETFAESFTGALPRTSGRSSSPRCARRCGRRSATRPARGRRTTSVSRFAAMKPA
jgi:SAM-dependent methyltransferase